MVEGVTADHPGDEPVTLHRIMQMMIGKELRERYQPPQKLSHALFVLLMQLKEQERREQRERAVRPRKPPGRRRAPKPHAPPERAQPEYAE
jgi:hypothetical protein